MDPNIRPNDNTEPHRPSSVATSYLWLVLNTFSLPTHRCFRSHPDHDTSSHRSNWICRLSLTDSGAAPVVTACQSVPYQYRTLGSYILVLDAHWRLPRWRCYLNWTELKWFGYIICSLAVLASSPPRLRQRGACTRDRSRACFLWAPRARAM